MDYLHIKPNTHSFYLNLVAPVNHIDLTNIYHMRPHNP